MCVGVPALVLSADDSAAPSRPARLRRIDGFEFDADLALIPEAAAGDFVITHSGFGVAVIDESLAFEFEALLSEYGRRTMT